MFAPLMTVQRGGLRLAATAPDAPTVLHLAGTAPPQPTNNPTPRPTETHGRAVLAARPALRQFLIGLPMLAFTDTGRANVCRRFALTDDELTAALLAFDEAGRQ